MTLSAIFNIMHWTTINQNYMWQVQWPFAIALQLSFLFLLGLLLVFSSGILRLSYGPYKTLLNMHIWVGFTQSNPCILVCLIIFQKIFINIYDFWGGGWGGWVLHFFLTCDLQRVFSMTTLWFDNIFNFSVQINISKFWGANHVHIIQNL